MGLKTINKDFLVKTLIKLVQTPSLSSKEKEVAEKVSKILEDFGYRPKIDKYYDVIVEVGKGKKTILLNSHIDTVPPIGNWSINPYAGIVANGKVYGLGASDNKSGVAAMIEIARIFSFKPPNGKVIFLFTSREESDKDEARKILIGKVKANFGICLDHHIHAKSKVADIVVGCRGIGNFTLKVYGKAYHSSEPEKAVNAIYRAISVVEAIRNAKLPLMLKPLKEKAVVSVTKINTDGWATRIPDQCNLTINYRALPKEKREKAEKRIFKLVKETLKKDFNINLDSFHEGYLVSLKHEIVKAAIKTVKQIKFKPKLSIAKGWVDAAFFNQMLGIPTICMGPGTQGQAHVKDEYEDIRNLYYGTLLVYKTVLNILGGEG